MQYTFNSGLRSLLGALRGTTSTQAMGRRLSQDVAGNVGMMFAMMIVPATAFVGVGVDYSRAFNAKSELQSIVDSAALRAAKTYQTTGDGSKAIEDARSWFNSAVITQMHNGSGANVKVALNEAYVSPSGTVTVDADVSVPTTFLKLSNINELTGNVKAVASVPVEPLDVEMALVFDITGSMDDPMPQAEPDGTRKDKIDVAKESAKAMIDIMMPEAAHRNKIRMSLVPFSQTVNIGDYIASASGQVATRTVDEGKWEWKCIRKSRNTCLESGWVWKSIMVNYYRKNCTAERMNTVANHGYDDAMPINSSTYFPVFWTKNASARDSSCTPTDRLIPLTEDKQQLKQAVDNIVATGGTAGHIGAAWGWYTVSPNWSDFWPTDSKPEPHDLTQRIKAVVIMSDGDFNYAYTSSYSGVQNSYPTGGNGTSSTQALAICRNMKNQGFEVFTVAVGVAVGSNGYKTLRDCASSPNHMFQQHFYYVVRSSEFANAFQDIATKVSRATGTGAAAVKLVQ